MCCILYGTFAQLQIQCVGQLVMNASRCDADYVQLLNTSGQLKTARRNHLAVDMQFEFRIEAVGEYFMACSEYYYHSTA